MLPKDILFEKSKILDPCAGGDNNHPMSYPTAIDLYWFPTPPVTTIDIREDSKAKIIGDFLAMTEFELGKDYDLVITNPPFAIAREIIEKSLEFCRPGGYVIMLLRLNFFGSQARRDFFKNNMPKFTFVHSKRMRFLNTGGTDSIEYMHCIWEKGRKQDTTTLRII